MGSWRRPKTKPPVALATIAAVVTDPDGKPVEGVMVLCSGGVSGVTNEDGYVNLGIVQVGRYTFSAHKAGWIDSFLGTDADPIVVGQTRDIFITIEPVPKPKVTLLPARIEQGRYRTDAGWFVPRFYSCLEAIWLVQRGHMGELRRRLDRAVAARCNGIRIFGMLDWGTIRYSPRDADYIEALESVVEEAAQRGCYTEWSFFCDAQRIVPANGERDQWTRMASVFCHGHPTVWFQVANEARKNGWAEADDPKLLELAKLFKSLAPSTLLSVSDPADPGLESGGSVDEYMERQRRIAEVADYLVVHPSRDDPNFPQGDGRYRRWVDHMKGAGEGLIKVGKAKGRALLIDEPMGAASVRQKARRDDSVVAHVAAATLGAMLGGYTYLHRPDEDDAAPGLLESAFAADIPGSPDCVFRNATIAGSPVSAFTGYDKIRTMNTAVEAWAVGYGKQGGPVTWASGWHPSVVTELRDDSGLVTVWRATR